MHAISADNLGYETAFDARPVVHGDVATLNGGLLVSIPRLVPTGGPCPKDGEQ